MCGFVSSYVFQFRLANLTLALTQTPQPDPEANANQDPPTLADRVVPIHGWRLVIVLCAYRTRAGCALFVQGNECT